MQLRESRDNLRIVESCLLHTGRYSSLEKLSGVEVWYEESDGWTSFLILLWSHIIIEVASSIVIDHPVNRLVDLLLL